MLAVWEYFTVSENNYRYAACKTGAGDISRRSTINKNFNTSGLIAHLKSRHNYYLKVDKKWWDRLATKKWQSTTSKTQMMTTAFQIPTDSAEAKGITNKVDGVHRIKSASFLPCGVAGFESLIDNMEPWYTLPGCLSPWTLQRCGHTHSWPTGWWHPCLQLYNWCMVFGC